MQNISRIIFEWLKQILFLGLTDCYSTFVHKYRMLPITIYRLFSER